LTETLKQLQRVEKRINELRVEINDHRHIEDPAPVDVRTLEDEVETLDRKITELEAKKTELSGKVEDARRTLDMSERDLQNVEDRIRTAAQKLDPYREKLAQIDNEVHLPSHVFHNIFITDYGYRFIAEIFLKICGPFWCKICGIWRNMR